MNVYLPSCNYLGVSQISSNIILDFLKSIQNYGGASRTVQVSNGRGLKFVKNKVYGKLENETSLNNF